jgi:hypothetical protein
MSATANNLENSCNCIEIIGDLKAGKCEVAKTKIANNNCCRCGDEGGNTMLHVLAKMKMEPMDECCQVLSHVLDKPNIAEFINKQNCEGETAFLVAVKHENEVGANMLENKGADGTIKDNAGNFVKLETDEVFDVNKHVDRGETSLNLDKNNLTTMYVGNTANTAPSSALENTEVFFENLFKDLGRTVEKAPSTVYNTVTAPISALVAETTSDAIPSTQTDKVGNNDLNTDAMLEKVKTIVANQKANVPTPTTVAQAGGMYGASHFTRRHHQHSDEFPQRGGDKWNPVRYDGGYSDDDDDDEDRGKSELSRLINNRKNELHNEVEARLLEMLNNGLITYKSKPVEATEKNAKLLKSFLYQYVRDKNPTLSGMDKITTIKNMPDSEIIELTVDVDLDAVESRNEGFRQKHLEEKEARHKEKANMREDSDTTLSVEDIITEKPKKSKAEKEEKKKSKEDKKEKKKSKK